MTQELGIQDLYYYCNVDTYNIRLLLAVWDTEDFMDAPSTLHMRESYALKYQICDPDNPTYMESLSG